MTWKTLKPKIKRYFKNTLIGFDQFANAVLLGYPDETFSARIYRKNLAGQRFWRLLRWTVDKMFFWDTEHCKGSYERELAGGHGPKEYQA